MYKNQHEKIYQLMLDRKWTCTTLMRREFIADPPKRLQEMRDNDHIKMKGRICQSHNYHTGNDKEWTLLRKRRVA